MSERCCRVLTCQQVKTLLASCSTVALFTRGRPYCSKETALRCTEEQHTVIIFAFQNKHTQGADTTAHNTVSHKLRMKRDRLVGVLNLCEAYTTQWNQRLSQLLPARSIVFLGFNYFNVHLLPDAHHGADCSRLGLIRVLLFNLHVISHLKQ